MFYFRNQDSTPEGPVVISYAIKDPFVTNVKESQKLFKTTVVLGINDKKLTEYLDENLHNPGYHIIHSQESVRGRIFSGRVSRKSCA